MTCLSLSKTKQSYVENKYKTIPVYMFYNMFSGYFVLKTTEFAVLVIIFAVNNNLKRILYGWETF